MHASDFAFSFFQTLPTTRANTQSTVPKIRNITKTKAKARKVLITNPLRKKFIIRRKMEATKDIMRMMMKDTRRELGMKRSTRTLRNTERRVDKIITIQTSTR